MTAYTRDELLDIAAAYATGAASSEEELALSAAMTSDADLRDEVELNRRALEAMTEAQAVTPTDLVRGRLLAQARLGAEPALQSMPRVGTPWRATGAQHRVHGGLRRKSDRDGRHGLRDRAAAQSGVR